MKKGTTIWVSQKNKEALDKLKIIPQEPYDRVLKRLIESWKKKGSE